MPDWMTWWMVWCVGVVCGVTVSSLGATAKGWRAATWEDHKRQGEAPARENAYLRGYGAGRRDAAILAAARARAMAPRSASRLVLLDVAQDIDGDAMREAMAG